MDSVHYDNINCLAYYGITTGKTADTYDPQSSVTRSQMALFLTRAADKAGIDLGDAMNMGFTDLDMSGADRAAAINVLASKGIMPGRTATTFDPEGTVTRADMAQHLFTLLDLALGSIHIDNSPMSVDGDAATGKININVGSDGLGQEADDFFGDVRRTQPVALADMINAVYELGITNGTNGMTGDSGTFEPDKPVTRAQMASFIMRAMSHTNLRPAGLTAQQTRTETQVSMRDADFAPISGARVEVFSSNFAEDAFDSRGRCVGSYVTGVESGFDVCEIDFDDLSTGADGNANFATSAGGVTITCTTSGGPYTLETQGSAIPDRNYKVWAWTGDQGDAVGDETTLVEVVSANQKASGRSPAASAALSGGTTYTAKMGRTVTYTLQLLDARNQPTGPNPGGSPYDVTIERQSDTSSSDSTTITLEKVTTTRTPDSNGLIRIPVSNPGTAGDDLDVTVSITVDEAAGNSLTTIATAGISEATPTPTRKVAGAQAAVVFSDDAAVATSLDATVRPWLFVNDRNHVTATVRDQYGDPHGGAAGQTIEFGTPQDTTTAAAQRTISVSTRGTAQYSYRNLVGTAVSETVTLTPTGFAPALVAGNQQLTTQWATTAGTVARSSASTGVLVGDPSGYLVVAGSVAYRFGSDDTFEVGGTRLTLGQFREVLSVAASTDTAISPLSTSGVVLDWYGYNANRPRDRADFVLTGLTCS